jgi:hypothetical protein
MSTIKQLQALEKRRAVLIERLCQTQAMIKGSFSTSYRRCGQANCRCAEGKGHPMNRISYTDQGKSRTKLVRAEDIEWAKQMTEFYKRFRKDRQALRQLEKKLNLAIDQLETKTITRTAAKRGYEF